MRTIDGISYAVRAWDSSSQKRCLHVSIPLERRGDRYLSAVSNVPELAEGEIGSVCFRFTTDNWKSAAEVGGRLAKDDQDGLVLDFEDIRRFPLIGRLEGYCHLNGAGKPNRRHSKPKLSRYVFAIPDRRELKNLMNNPSFGVTAGCGSPD